MLRTLTKILAVCVLMLVFAGGEHGPRVLHAQPAPDAPHTIYGDALAPGWQDWSWGTARTWNITAPVHSGTHSAAYGHTTSTWSGLYLHHNGVNTAPFTHVRVSLWDAYYQQTWYVVARGAAGTDLTPLRNIADFCTISTSVWTVCDIPLSSLGAADQALTGLLFRAPAVGQAMWLDQIQLVDLAAHVFVTLPPGSALPTDAECAARVRRSPWEPRPTNGTPNATVPSGLSLPDFQSVDSRANTEVKPRITGNFTGTTDEIIQHAACKWGFDEELARAVAAQESWWRQETAGDGGISFGLMQIKSTDWAGTSPTSQNSTAFNVDYVLAVRRMCFEGYIPWLTQKAIQAGYLGTVGDEWGCIGFWFSGGWYDGDEDDPNDPNDAWSGAKGYISHVLKWLNRRVWREAGF